MSKTQESTLRSERKHFFEITILLFMQTRKQEYLKGKEITEMELLNELRGYYKPSFFYIYLKGKFSKDIEDLSNKDRGTFIHEYIHYIQNIATYWGLYCSIVRYQELSEFKSQLTTSVNIEIPLNIERSDSLKRKIERVKFGNGFSVFDESLSWNIDTAHKIVIEKDSINLYGKNYNIIYLILKFEDQRIERINLGAHIIKESMSAMYQSLVDEDAKHNDVPYNIIKELCKQHFPNISFDIEKLICICYTSLFSMSPGAELILLLEKASSNITLNGMDVFTEFVNEKRILAKDNFNYTVTEYFDILIDGFKKTLAFNLQTELDYINSSLERVRISNKLIPFLSILYDPNKLSTDNLNALIGYYGVPYIQTLENGYHFPQSTKEDAKEDDSSMDVLELIAQEAMFSYMTSPRVDKICPLFYMCSQSEYSKDGCFGMPWEKPLCAFTIVSSPFSLDNKRISWKF